MTQNYIKTRVRLPNSNESNLFVYVPVAGYTNPGIAMFDEDYFNIDADGKVSIYTQGNSSIVTKTYLETNYYDKTTIDTTLSTKLDKVISSADSLRLYGINEDGSQTTKFAAISGANTVMLRDNAGKSQVTTPSDGDSDLVIANKGYVDNAGFLKQIGFYNQLVPIANQSVTTITIDSITYYLLGGLSNVKEGYAYYVGEVNNVHYWDTFVCLRVVNGTALFWPFRAISGSVPNNATAHYHVFATDGSGNNITIKYAVDPAIGTGAIMKRDANGRAQVSNPFANLDIANKQYVDNYAVQKIATAGSYVRLYGIGQDGTQGVYNATSDANAGSIVRRNANGSTSFADPVSSQNAATKNYVDTKVASLGTVFNIKGTVSTVSALPSTGNTVGDVYFVTADNSEYVWTSSNTWEQFGPTIDINGAIDTRLSSKYDIREGNGLLEIGSSGHNLYFTGYEAITFETADGGSGNGIELYDSYGYNYLRVNSTGGVMLLADHKFNISAAGGDTYVRTDDAMDLHLYGSSSVQVDGAFRIESDSPNASPFHYDAGCIQMCNGKVYLDYATNINYTTNTFNIAIPNLYKTFNQNTMQYSNPYATASDVSAAVANMVTTNTSQTINAIKQFRASSGQYKFFVGVEDEEGDGIPETYSQFRIYQNGYQFRSLNSASSGSVYSNRTTKVDATPSTYEITATEAPGSPGYYIKLDMDSNYLLGDIGYIDHWHNRVSNITWQDGDLTLYGEQAIAVGVGSGDLLVNLEPTQIDVVIGTEMELRIDNNGMYADFDGSYGNYFQMGRGSNSVDIVIGDDPTNSNKTYNVTLRGTNIDIEADTKVVADKLYKSYTSASVNNPYVDKQTYDSLVARVAALESALSIQNS